MPFALPHRQPGDLLIVTGLLCLAGLWLGPLPGLAAQSFSAHMLLHLGVMSLAAPLLALGLARGGLRRSWLEGGRGWLAGLFMAELLVVWGWHVPALHEAAAGRVWVFVIQQLSFLLTGLALWIAGFASERREAQAVALLGFGLTVGHMTMLGLLLALAPRLLYPAELCGGAFGYAGLEDQRAGGVLMLGGALLYLGVALALGARLLGPADSSPVSRT